MSSRWAGSLKLWSVGSDIRRASTSSQAGDPSRGGVSFLHSPTPESAFSLFRAVYPASYTPTGLWTGLGSVKLKSVPIPSRPCSSADQDLSFITPPESYILSQAKSAPPQRRSEWQRGRVWVVLLPESWLSLIFAPKVSLNDSWWSEGCSHTISPVRHLPHPQVCRRFGSGVFRYYVFQLAFYFPFRKVWKHVIEENLPFKCHFHCLSQTWPLITRGERLSLLGKAFRVRYTLDRAPPHWDSP